MLYCRNCACVLQGVNVPKLEEAINSPRVADIIASHVTFCGRGLGLKPGASALLSNGRVRRKGGREGVSNGRRGGSKGVMEEGRGRVREIGGK